MTTVHAQTGIKLATKPAKTSLLGGHFIYKANGTTETPSSANVVEYVDNNPALWRHNVHIGSNGIKLRYGETTLSKWDTGSLIFYIPTTTNGITTTTKGLQLSSAGLEIFGSSQSTADLTATSNGINIGKGSIVGADNTVTNYVPNSGFLYLSTKNYNAYLNVAGSGNKTDWRLVVGNNFGITKDGNVYMSGATVSGKIVALTGQIGGTYVGDSWGWTLSTGQLYTGTIGTNNSLHMRSFNLSSDVTINGESRADWRFTVGSKFGVTKNGEIFATDANLSGIIKANEGSIGGANGWTISSQEIKSTDYNITQTGSIYLSTKDLTTATTINGQSRTDWRFTIGDKFGVTKDGYLHANGAYLTNINVGTITISDISGLQNSLTYAQNNADYYFDDIANGVAVHNYTSTTQPDNRIEITSQNGLEIFKGGVSVAQYSTTARIGQVANDASRIRINNDGIDFYNRTSNQDVTLAHIGYDTGNTSSGTTSQVKFPYYTFGKRAQYSTIGNWSMAEGEDTEASGCDSHAEGDSTIARAHASHAEGIETKTYNNGTVLGSGAHAEGFKSEACAQGAHAEGYCTKAMAYYSHAGGEYSVVTVNGTRGFAHGDHVTSDRNDLFVIGRYNNTTNSANRLFIIGNGWDSSPKNVFEVDIDGKTYTNQIQGGTIAAADVAIGGIRTVNVTFNREMSGTPIVVATLYSASANDEVGSVSVGVSSISSTGFTCKIFNNSSLKLTPGVKWLAINSGFPTIST